MFIYVQIRAEGEQFAQELVKLQTTVAELDRSKSWAAYRQRMMCEST
jgi:hypothetical protein